MPDLVIASIAFNVPWSVDEQIRLFAKYVEDDHALVVFDNSTPANATYIEGVCRETDTMYIRCRTENREHHEALNYAAEWLANRQDVPFFGFVDHDLWPAEPIELIPLIEKHGFLCVGQRHIPTDHLYPWPGCLFFSREWLAGRPLDFEGIRAPEQRLNGDTGSGLWPLFSEEDWRGMFLFRHGYEAIRRPNSEGVQSWAVETIGPFIHGTNVSRWMAVHDPDGRERLLREKVASL